MTAKKICELVGSTFAHTLAARLKGVGKHCGPRDIRGKSRGIQNRAKFSDEASSLRVLPRSTSLSDMSSSNGTTCGTRAGIAQERVCAFAQVPHSWV